MDFRSDIEVGKSVLNIHGSLQVCFVFTGKSDATFLVSLSVGSNKGFNLASAGVNTFCRVGSRQLAVGGSISQMVVKYSLGVSRAFKDNWPEVFISREDDKVFGFLEVPQGALLKVCQVGQYIFRW